VTLRIGRHSSNNSANKKSVELLERNDQSGQRRYTYRVTFREGLLVLVLGLDPDNKILLLDETPEE